MARRPQVRYFESRNGYYTQHRGKQHRLADGPDDAPTGPTYLAALTAFRELLEVASAPERGQGNTVRVLVEKYGIEHLEANGQLKSLRILTDCLRSAMPLFGDLAIDDLKPLHVQGWLNGQTQWGPTTKRIAFRTLIAALNWSKKMGYITSHPVAPSAITIRGVKKSRGKEAYIPGDTWERIMERPLKPHFRAVLRFLHGTGCRPAEAFHVEARYYDANRRAVVFPGQPGPDDYVWKMALKTGRDRVIFVPDELVGMVEELIARYPTGPIFRTRQNRRYNSNGFGLNMRWVARVLELKPVPSAYGFRHTFATDFLLSGGSVKVLADLLGTSVAMIDRHYGHLEVDAAKMRSIMASVMGGRSLRKEPEAPRR